MSVRRTILRELKERREQDAAGYTRPGTIDGFAQRPARYQQAVNALLRERLINGTRDAGGRLAIAINEDRFADVERALRPIWTRPVVWLAAIAAATATGFIWTIL